jgi:hypothetical protein
MARMGEIRKAYEILVENPKGRDQSEDLVVVGKILLKRVLNK